ncbi:DUF4190 domain-containing protein [Streptomyces sp. NPDC001691]|uniref:DUF4190 domain-containing protein n=1 Tax=Streptomyces sp. NPDC001691 TaxID=3364600 RepID=UPI003698F12B
MEIPPPPAPGQPQQPQPGQGYGWSAPHQAPGGHPGPYPGQPVNGGPWYPYPPAPQRPPVSGLAIGSLVTGIVCCVPPLGLLLGALALGQIKKKGQRGKGMAVTGVVLSTISTLLLIVSIATGGLADGWQSFKDGWNSSTSTRNTLDLRKGDCFDVPGGKLEREVASVRIVPCAGRHDGEVSGSFRLKENGAYPGAAAISSEAETRCWDVEQAYAMDSWKIPAKAEPYYYTPSRKSWSLGDHSVTCAFASAAGKLEGSVRNDAATLDADQIAFLKAANDVERTLAKAPDEDRVEDDLPGFRKWAGEMTGVLGLGAQDLGAHTWAAGRLASVQPYLNDLKAAQMEWVQASGATDADAFYLHSGAADKAMKQADEIAARRALGLATTPPSTEGHSGGSGGGTGGGSGSGSGSGGSKSV